MQGFDQAACCGLKQRRDDRMDQRSQTGSKKGQRERAGKAHMLKIGLIDAGGVVNEPTPEDGYGL